MIDRTRKWLSLRIKPVASRGKQKNIPTDNPQSRIHKEYTRRTGSESRNNTSTDREEEDETPLTTEELKQKLNEKMKEVEYLAKQVSFGITIGLGATPQVEIHPDRPTIEGVAAMIEQPSQEAQSSSTTTTPTTTTTVTLATTSTAFVAPTVSTCPPLVITMVTSSFVISQMSAPTMNPTTKIVTIHNVESKSEQEEVEPTPKKVGPKKMKIMTPSSVEKQREHVMQKVSELP